VPFWICAEVMSACEAAYAPPDRATNSATRATTIAGDGRRTVLRIKIAPFLGSGGE
jgi:hypothetical protein